MEFKVVEACPDCEEPKYLLSGCVCGYEKTIKDLRAQVARLEKRVQELTPVVDELIKGETNTAVLPKAICPFCQSRRPYDAGATDYTRVCFGCMRESPVEEWREE